MIMDNLFQVECSSPSQFMGIIGGVAFLFIVLTIIVAYLKVNKYRSRFWELQNTNEEKNKQILILKEEVEALKIKNATNEQELKYFAETKKALDETQSKCSIFQDKHTATEKDLSKNQALLSSKEGMYQTLLEDYKTLKDEQNQLLEDNSKFRISNARLLMKSEQQ